MSLVTGGLEQLRQAVKAARAKTARSAASIAAEESRRAANPEAFATLEAAAQVPGRAATAQTPYQNINELEMQITHAYQKEAGNTYQSHYVNEDDMVELGFDFAPPPPAEVALPPSVKPFEKDLVQGDFTAGVSHVPEDIPKLHGVVGGPVPEMVRQYRMRLDQGIRNVDPDMLAFDRRIAGTGKGLAMYEPIARKTMVTMEKMSVPGRFVAGVRMGDIPYMGATIAKDTGGPRSYKLDRPITLVVEPTEHEGLVKLVDAQLPDGMTSIAAHPEIADDMVPVVMRTADGSPLPWRPRAVEAEGKNGKAWFNMTPDEKVYPEAREAQFTDPSKSTFWSYLPRNPQQMREMVTSLFSPEGMTFGGAINNVAFLRSHQKGPLQFQVFRENYFNNMEGTRSIGTWVGDQEHVSIAMGYRKAVAQRENVLNQHRAFYSNWKGAEDAHYLARLKAYAHDSPYKLSMLGETDPVLKDLPMIMFHTDQRYFDPVLAGDNADFIQFGKSPAEGGMHLAFSRTQADELLKKEMLLALDSADPTVLRDYWRSMENEIKADMEQYFDHMFGNTLGSYSKQDEMWFFSTVSDILEGPGRRQAASGVRSGVAHDMARDVVDAAKRIKKRFKLKKEVREIAEGLGNIVDEYGRIMRESSQSSFVFRGRNPLLLLDRSRFDHQSIASQLLAFPQFQHARKQLNKIALNENGISAWTDWDRFIKGAKDSPEKIAFEAQHKWLTGLMEDAGFDHILYINAKEQPGLPSVITWKQNHVKLTWATLFDRRSNDTLRGLVPVTPALPALLQEEGIPDGTAQTPAP